MGFNTFIVTFSALFLGIASGVIGSFLILRKRALISDAMAHGTLPGLCLAFICGYYFLGHGRELWILLIGAALSGLFSNVLIQLIVDVSRIREDTALASILSIFFGVGILLLGIIQNLGTGEEGGLNHFIYGQTAAMGVNDAIAMLIITIIVIFSCWLLFKEFKLLCFNEDYAKSIGYNTKLLDFILTFLSSIVIVIGLQAVGMLLVVALLVIPSAAARYWSNNVNNIVICSAIFGGISGITGSILSSLIQDVPTGGMIVLSSATIFVVSFMFHYRKIKKNKLNGIIFNN